MQLTRTIIEAMAEGYESYKFTCLLEQYGIWKRYTGCLGFPSGHTAKTAHIDDKSAMIIDACSQRLKEHSSFKGSKDKNDKYHYGPYKVYWLFYGTDFTLDDIRYRLNPCPEKNDRIAKRMRRKNGIVRGPRYYGVDPAFAETLYRAGPDAYLMIKRLGDAKMYGFLYELHNNKDNKNEKL